MIIGRKQIGDTNPCFIIAEAGVNHNGSVDLAKELIDVAKDAGADAVKFQTFKAEDLVTEKAEKADYQRHTTAPDESQYQMLKNLELSHQDFRTLSQYARKKEIVFLSTPFDQASVDLLDGTGMAAFKIPSGEITNIPLLRYVARKKKPILLSTGMSTLGEVEEAVNCLQNQGNSEIVLFHCLTQYPAPIEDANLQAMQTLHCSFKLPVGFSDHTPGIVASIAAVALGACIIEKHFTLDKAMPGPDHSASLEPHELKAMVDGIRDVERAMGNGLKSPTPAEQIIKRTIRKSIVAAKEIPSGAVIDESMLAIKRPGTGIEPKYWNDILGKRTRISIPRDHLIRWRELEGD